LIQKAAGLGRKEFIDDSLLQAIEGEGFIASLHR
jgi:hypothetical protein